MKTLKSIFKKKKTSDKEYSKKQAKEENPRRKNNRSNPLPLQQTPLQNNRPIIRRLPKLRNIPIKDNFANKRPSDSKNNPLERNRTKRSFPRLENSL